MITIDFSKRGPLGLCEYLYSSIKSQILDGTLRANEKLPSKRALSENLGVSVITVQNAYAELIAEGYIYSIEKKGFFVTELQTEIETRHAELFSASTSRFRVEHGMTDNSPRNDVLSSTQNDVRGLSSSKPQNATSTFSHFESLNDQIKPLNHQVNVVVEALETTASQSIFCDFQNNSTSYEKFPFSLWSHTMRQVLNSGDEKLLQRVGVKGVFELRESISKYLREFRNLNVSPEQIVIGAGTENIFSMIVQFLGRENVFALENPGYKKIASVCRLNGAKIVPVNIDEHGINIEELEKSGANVAHVSPNHHFPTGIVMPIRRRQEILSWAANEKNRFIIEDDYDSEFRFNGKPLSTLFSADQTGKVIYINTFSKTLSPSFRISFMVLPFSLLREFENQFGLYSCPVSSFEQFTLSRFINDGNYGKHIIRMKNFYRNLRNSLISAIQQSRLKKNCKIREEESGLHFLLTIKSEQSATELEERLLREGIKLPLLSNYYYENNNVGREPCGNYAKNEKTFIVNYSGIKKEKIAEIVRRMEKAIFGK